MEDTQIIELWKQYDKKLEDSLVFNRQCVTELTKIKVQSLLASMKPLKIFTILAGIVWAIFLDVLIVTLLPVASPFFVGSAILLALINKLAIGIYLYQLILVHQAAIEEPVLATQERLARLKSSTLWVARILFLQLPLWTVFYWNKSMLENGNTALFIIQAIVTLSFFAMALWLFQNIKYKNRNKKWFRLIFNGREWSPVMKSIDLLSQVVDYKTETAMNNEKS